MASSVMVLPIGEDLSYIRLAREIAIEHDDIETILNRYSISSEEWLRIRESPRFVELLRGEIESWQGATNTHERTKLKAAAIVEFFLPEASTKLHDPGENLPAKVELFKAITRIAGMGLDRANIEGAGGEKFSVTINLGSDHSLKFEKNITPKVIEGEVL